MSIHTKEELRNMQKVPAIQRIAKALENLIGKPVPYPIALEIQHETEALMNKLKELGY